MNPQIATTVFEQIEREVWIVAAAHEGRRGGLIATFVNPASIVRDMPRMVVGIAKTHETWKLIEGSGAFALHLINESQLDLVWRFGLQSSRDVDKFADLDCMTAVTGSPILRDVLGWLDCRVEDRLDTGDRTIYLAEVVEAARLGDKKPLSLQRLIAISPSETLDVLRTQMAADAAHDAAQIAHWRDARH